MLEPNWLDLPHAESRFQLLGNWHSVRDPWFEIRRAHPLQSELRPDVHPHLFLVAEREDANEADAMALCRLERDGRLPEFEVLGRVSAGEALGELERWSALMEDMTAGVLLSTSIKTYSEKRLFSGGNEDGVAPGLRIIAGT